MRKTSVPAPFGGLMIAGVVVAVAAPFLGWILQALALLINSYWSIPCIDYILVEVIPCVPVSYTHLTLPTTMFV